MKSSYRYCKPCRTLHDGACPNAAPAEDMRYDPAAHYDEFLSGPRAGTFLQCASCKGIHEVSAWPHNCLPPAFDLRSDLAAPMVVNDNLEKVAGLNGMVSFADGKRYTSYRRYKAELRAHGMVEVGNDSQRLTPSKRVRAPRAKIKAAVERAFSKVGFGA